MIAAMYCCKLLTGFLVVPKFPLVAFMNVVEKYFPTTLAVSTHNIQHQNWRGQWPSGLVVGFECRGSCVQSPAVATNNSHDSFGLHPFKKVLNTLSIAIR